MKIATFNQPHPQTWSPHTHHQAPTVHGINSRIVFLTLSDVLCVWCQYIGIHSRNVFLNRSGLILKKKIRKFAQNRQTDRQTDKQTDRQRIQLQRPLLSPVDRGGERANNSSSKSFKFLVFVLLIIKVIFSYIFMTIIKLLV